MKRHIETSIKLILILLLVALAATQASAQPNDTSLFEPVTDTPINTGIALMAAAGMGYGMKKLKRFKK